MSPEPQDFRSFGNATSDQTDCNRLHTTIVYDHLLDCSIGQQAHGWSLSESRSANGSSLEDLTVEALNGGFGLHGVEGSGSRSCG